MTALSRTEYQNLGAVQIAGLVRSGALSARDVTAAAIDSICGRDPAVRAFTLTGDGFQVAKYATQHDTADRLAAACSALQSLSAAIAAEFPDGGAMRTVVIECSGGFFYLMAAGRGTFLATLADPHVDPGLMGERMRDLVGRLGEHLASPPRSGVPMA